VLRKTFNPADHWKLAKASYFWPFAKAALTGFKNNDNRFYIKETLGKGRGLFTKIPFKKGELVLIMRGPTRYFKAETPEECYVYPDWFSVDKNIWIEPGKVHNFMNHSCDPNLGLKGNREFVARRDIKADEELCFDYSTTDDELPWSFACACGVEKCRGTVGPIQHLTREQFEGIMPFVPPHFQKVYERYHTRRPD
jgi:hypothetical protein